MAVWEVWHHRRHPPTHTPYSPAAFLNVSHIWTHCSHFFPPHFFNILQGKSVLFRPRRSGGVSGVSLVGIHAQGHFGRSGCLAAWGTWTWLLLLADCFHTYYMPACCKLNSNWRLKEESDGIFGHRGEKVLCYMNPSPLFVCLLRFGIYNLSFSCRIMDLK